MNASGRLDTAKRALELLSSKTRKEADVLAGDLKALNDSRKDMTMIAVEDATRIVEETAIQSDKVLVIYLPDCHESLAGIVAGRIRERYHKPAFILTKGEVGLKGSGRSIENYHMYEGLNKCKHLLTKFGGHKLAAGLSLEEENLEDFRKLLNEESGLTEDDLMPKISIDMQLPLCHVTEGLVNQLELLEPFGKGNNKPVFVEKDLDILSSRVFGKNRNVVKMQLRDKSGSTMEAVYFGDAERFMDYYSKKDGKAAFTFYPTVNEYQGRKSVQIVIQNYQ